MQMAQAIANDHEVWTSPIFGYQKTECVILRHVMGCGFDGANTRWDRTQGHFGFKKLLHLLPLAASR